MASKSDLDTYGCSICLEILFEPITMPCQHKMCKPCFAKNLELTNMHCPFCKKRIGTWCRRAKNIDTLIDKPLWTFIQENYQTEIQNRIKGKNFKVYLITYNTSFLSFTENTVKLIWSKNVCFVIFIPFYFHKFVMIQITKISSNYSKQCHANLSKCRCC